jgi:hypothetical protein
MSCPLVKGALYDVTMRAEGEVVDTAARVYREREPTYSGLIFEDALDVFLIFLEPTNEMTDKGVAAPRRRLLVKGWIQEIADHR